MAHEKRELILPPQSHFAGTAWEGDECDKFLAMWLQQRQTGRGRARKGQPTEPRTSFASPIFLGVVVAVGELRADAVREYDGFSVSEMVSESKLNSQLAQHVTFPFDLFNRTFFRANSHESCTVLSPSIFTSCEQYCLCLLPLSGECGSFALSLLLLSCFCVFYS